MDLSCLRKIAAECRQNPNYHFRTLTDEEFDSKARASFQRLPEAQQTKVQTSWLTTLEKNKEALTKDTATELLRLRFLAQTNLYFLCKLLEKYSQVTLATHEEICNSFFVQKDPTFITFEKFAKQYTDLRDRLLLVPRNGFKSSIDIADSVQWCICFPEVTILILTGVYKLASDFVGELKQHFTLEESGVTDPKTNKSGFAPRKLLDPDKVEWSDSLFQVIFPEHCIPPGSGSQFEFQTPAGGDDRQPTVRAASIEQALSGMHFGVLKLDDVVTNENCRTADRIKSINDQISVNRAMLNPYGFNDVIGTWYDESDYYGTVIKQEERTAAEEGRTASISGSVDSGRFTSSVLVKVYLRAAWWPTEEAKKAGLIESEMKQADWELWFPERLDYDFLVKEKKKDGDSGNFAIKFLNNPRQIHKVKFPRELLVRRTIPHSQLPPQGFMVTTVDTAYSTKSWADYTVILTSLIYGGRFYVVNMVRGRFNEFELPAVIAAAAYKWKPKRLAIEDSVGVRWMANELRREMDKLRIRVPVEYVPLGAGNKASSKKQVKAKPVMRLLGDERMFFLNSCEGLEEIYSELEKFTGTDDDAHDDIVSALSLLWEQFGHYADQVRKTEFNDYQSVNERQQAEMHDMIYGIGRYSRYNAANDDNPVTAYQVQTLTAPDSYESVDPFADLMQ